VAAALSSAEVRNVRYRKQLCKVSEGAKSNGSPTAVALHVTLRLHSYHTADSAPKKPFEPLRRREWKWWCLGCYFRHFSFLAFTI